MSNNKMMNLNHCMFDADSDGFNMCNVQMIIHSTQYTWGEWHKDTFMYVMKDGSHAIYTGCIMDDELRHLKSIACWTGVVYFNMDDYLLFSEYLLDYDGTEVNAIGEPIEFYKILHQCMRGYKKQLCDFFGMPYQGRTYIDLDSELPF